MSIFIPYVKTDTDELKYTIKGILQNFPSPGMIYVVGDDPEIDDPRVTHVEQTFMPLQTADPFSDVEAKFKSLASQYSLKDVWIFNDDFFILKPVKKIVLAHKGELESQLRLHAGRSDYYSRALRDTFEFLQKHGVDKPLNYELHIPMSMNVRKRLQYEEMIRDDVRRGKRLLMRSIYGNLEDVGGIRMEDVKNPERYSDKIFLSTSNKTFVSDHIGEYVRRALG